MESRTQAKKPMSMTSSRLTKWSLTAALTALAAFATLLIRIPIPATTGYFNLGDVFVVWAGLWLGPVAGLIVGAVGPTMSDAIGFPVFILATAITKGLEGFLVGLLARSSKKLWVKAVAAGVGASVIVIGYFAFEAFIYPALGKRIPFFAITDYGAALVEILPNLVQAVVATVLGLAMWKATSK